MNTIRLISNISYNSDSFFEGKISELIDQGVIDFCFWIRHQPDLDDKKSHIHFVLKPSQRIDTSKLRDYFNELDPSNDKPLTCTTVWRFTSSLQDWLLYCIHDRDYLRSKHLERNTFYKFSDIKSSDFDALNFEISMIDRVSFDRMAILQNAVLDHIPFFQLVQDGVIPISQRSQYEYQYNALWDYYFRHSQLFESSSIEDEYDISR